MSREQELVAMNVPQPFGFILLLMMKRDSAITMLDFTRITNSTNMAKATLERRSMYNYNTQKFLQ